MMIRKRDTKGTKVMCLWGSHNVEVGNILTSSSILSRTRQSLLTCDLFLGNQQRKLIPAGAFTEVSICMRSPAERTRRDMGTSKSTDIAAKSVYERCCEDQMGISVVPGT